jgi:hypothetical protein
MRAKDDAHAIELAIIRNLVWVLDIHWKQRTWRKISFTTGGRKQFCK